MNAAAEFETHLSLFPFKITLIDDTNVDSSLPKGPFFSLPISGDQAIVCERQTQSAILQISCPAEKGIELNDKFTQILRENGHPLEIPLDSDKSSQFLAYGVGLTANGVFVLGRV